MGQILYWLEELHAEVSGFTKERKWAELRDETNELKEWMLMGMLDDCPIDYERWLTDEQRATLTP